MIQETKYKMSIVIMSCDAFSDVWLPFFTLFNRFWPDCPYKKYLITEIKGADEYGCTTILAGSGKNWSDRLIYGLGQINDRYILFLQEDYFLNKPVNSSTISELIYLCENKNIENLRLYPAITSGLINQPDMPFGKIDKEKEKYIVSTQATIWSKEFLLSLMVANESVWDVERNGSSRAKKIQNDFYSVYPTTSLDNLDTGNYPVTYLFLTSITRGKWTRKTVRFCKKNGIFLNLKTRKANSWLDEYYFGKSPLMIRHLIDFVNCRTKKYCGIDLRTYPMRTNA